MRGSKIFKWFGKKFQIVFYHGHSYDVLNKLRLNRLGLILLLFLLFAFFYVINSLLIVYTPLKRLVPGYPNAETRKLIMENAIRLDSLEAELDKRDIYINVIRDALLNDVPIDEEYAVSPSILSEEQIKNFNNPIKPREKIEDLSNYIRIPSRIPDLYPPSKGMIINPYNPEQRHFGIDIASTTDSDIFSVYTGIVVLAEYNIENGYTIIIQHKQGFISVYKHLAQIFVRAGDMVSTGSLIGKYGNSGEYTTGPHLHFELWDKARFLNPEDYIVF